MKTSRKLHPPKDRSKTIVFLAPPGSQILDVAGPFQIFARAAELFVQESPARKAPYNVVVASTTRTKSVATKLWISANRK